MRGEMRPVRHRDVAGPAARVWDTNDVGQDEAFSYYREGICAAFMDLVPEAGRSTQARFSARVESVPLGNGAVNRVKATSHQVLRTPHEIAAAPDECFYLNYQTGGACRIEQGGRAATLNPGDVGLFDSTRPFVLEHRSRPTLAVHSFWVPRSALASRLRRDVEVGPAVLSHHGGIGKLVMETARVLGDGAVWMPSATSARLFDMLLDLTAMVLAGEEHARVDAAQARGDAILLRLKSMIARRLHDPQLNAAECASAAGISQRYMQKLFARQGQTFGGHVLQERLLAAAAHLREPAMAHLPISTIAYDCGFRDLSHFGRAFRTRFDCTPGDWRRQGD